MSKAKRVKITTKFEGQCFSCGKTYKPGQQVIWYPERKLVYGIGCHLAPWEEGYTPKKSTKNNTKKSGTTKSAQSTPDLTAGLQALIDLSKTHSTDKQHAAFVKKILTLASK